jgi:hypothetical protein
MLRIYTLTDSFTVTKLWGIEVETRLDICLQAEIT